MPSRFAMSRAVVGQVVGRADVAGQHAETARERVSFADRDARRAAPRSRASASAARIVAVVERRALFVGRRRCFEFFKVPRSGDQAEPDGFDFVGRHRAGEERQPPNAEAVAPDGRRSRRRGAARDVRSAGDPMPTSSTRCTPRVAAPERCSVSSRPPRKSRRARARPSAPPVTVSTGCEVAGQRRRAGQARRRAAAYRARRGRAPRRSSASVM